MLGVLETSLKGGTALYSSKLANIPGSVVYQSVRNYPKKPRWIPIAKSKMYKNLVFPVPPKYEEEENLSLYDNYKLYMTSIWKYQDKVSREEELQMQRNAKQVSEEVELERIFKMNDEINEKVRQLREATHARHLKEAEEDILEKKRLLEEEELMELEKAEKQIELEMERLKTQITLEQLDEAIEKALAVETDYNYGISRNGQYFLGRHNATEGVDGLPPTEPILHPIETTVVK